MKRLFETRFAYRTLAKLVILLVLVSASTQRSSAQEFNCTVAIDHTQLEGSTFEFLNQLGPLFEEYINRNVWTEDRFEPEERIECTISVQFLEALTLTRFRTNIVIASKRPIYGTVQTSTVLRIIDEGWTFSYAEGTPVIYDKDRFDELASLLDYYANILLAYDYDTFTEFGGTPYFEEARKLADRAKNEGGLGWASLGGDRTRTVIVAEMLDPTFRKLREVYFKYHFDGLDRFVTDTDNARINVMAALEELRQMSESRARSYVIDLFFSAKSQELAAIFRDSNERTTAYDILAELDTAHLSDYSVLVQ